MISFTVPKLVQLFGILAHIKRPDIVTNKSINVCFHGYLYVPLSFEGSETFVSGKIRAVTASTGDLPSEDNSHAQGYYNHIKVRKKSY